MPLNRRDVLRFAAGSAVGIAFTPVPWKLLDDSAIWTQNWSWTPRLPHAEVTTKFTTCTLCPAACGVQARCAGGRPFLLAGVAQHPSGRGVLCPAGIGGHHAAYDASRVRHVMRRGEPADLAAVIQAIREAKGTLAILDERPGRAISDVYRQFATGVHGVYMTPGPREEATPEILREMVDAPSAAFGIDLERTRTLLSFGAPILDGWCAPGRVWAARPNFRLMQAEPRQSRTAALADAWLPIRPGTEAALALGIANVIVKEGLAHADAARAADFAEYRALVERFTPADAAKTTGLPAERIVTAAREFAAGTPAIAVGGGDPGGGPLGETEDLAIAGLNLLVGSTGRRGGFVARRDTFERRGTPLAEVADGSIGVLIVDAAPSGDITPWRLLKKKLTPGAVVVGLSAFGADDLQPDFVVPAPAYLESVEDGVAPFDAPRAMFSLSPALLPPAPGAIEPAEFMAKLAAACGLPASGNSVDLAKARASAIHALRRGSVFSYAKQEATPLAGMASADQFWTALNEGACWLDDEPADAPPRRFRLLGKREGAAERLAAAAAGRVQLTRERPLALAPHGWRGAFSGAAVPLMTKLYQESGLREVGNEAALEPETARACGLEDGCTAAIETACGECRVRVRVSSAVMPGVIEAAIAPRRRGGAGGVLDVCDIDGCTWRVSAARIRRA